ncbi:MAG: GDP-mannose 4,6-dehydratase, partial [Microbacteriaceae bacterium]|nr:GDP-mannose 4,6-dehydratase [Microbacteriaceae bacterium]
MPVAVVTGATGQDGSYLCDVLVERGWTVHAVTRSADATAAPLPGGVVRHLGDLLEIESVTAAIKATEPDAVFNLAGITSVTESWLRPERTARVTGSAVAGILDASLQLQERLGRRVSVVQPSSAEIFGAPEISPQDESTPLRPLSPYGAAKAFAHDLVRIYRDRGLVASSVILYNHESPRRPTTFVTRKITAGAAAIARGEATSLSLGSLDAVRDWGWAPDYVEAMIRVAELPEPSDFVVATGVAHSVRDFVAAAFDAAGLGDWERYV